MARLSIPADGKITFIQDDQITTLIEDKLSLREGEMDVLTVGTLIVSGEIVTATEEEGPDTTTILRIDEIYCSKLNASTDITLGASGTLTINADTTVNGTTEYLNAVTVDAATSLGVAGTTNLSGVVNVTGNANFSNQTTTFTGSGDQEVAFNIDTRFTQPAEFFQTATFNNNITANNPTQINNTLDVTGLSTLTSVDINSGNIDNTVIGAGIPAAITGTTVTSNAGFVGNLQGNVTGTGNSSFGSISSGNISATGTVTVTNAEVSVSGGNLTVNPGTPENPYYIIGNLVGNIQGAVVDSDGNTVIDEAGDLIGDITGNVTGNVTGNLIGNVSGSLNGNVTATSGISIFENIQVNASAEIRNNLTVWNKVDLRYDDDSTQQYSAYQIDGEDLLSYGAASPSPQAPYKSNLAVGHSTLTSNTTGVQNTALGMNALTANLTGNNNVAVGQQAGSNLTSGNNNIIIGRNAQATSATVSNEITLGNSSHNTVRVPGADFTVVSGAITATSFSGSGNITTSSGNISTSSGTISATGNISTSGGTVSDNKGDLRRGDVVAHDLSASAYTIPSTASSTTFRFFGAASNAINIDGNNLVEGDVFIMFNQTANPYTINISNFGSWFRKVDDSGTNYNGSTLTLFAYGVATVNCITNNAAFISGNV